MHVVAGVGTTMLVFPFVSDARKITLVPPPRIYRLESIERQPAHLYQLSETEGRILPSVMASTCSRSRCAEPACCCRSFRCSRSG